MTEYMKKLDLQLFAQSYADTQTTLLNQPGNDMSPEMKTFYNKVLIKSADPELVYDRFGDNVPIPEHSGKSMEMRKLAPLKKATTPLVEGVTPDGNKTDVSTVIVEVHQFGDFIRFSDVLDVTAIDNMAVEYTEMLGSQAGRTGDTITRDVVCAGTCKMFAPAVKDGAENEVLSRGEVNTSCRLTPKVMRKAVNYLKRVNAKPFEGGYVAIIHPDTSCDVTGDPEWVEAHKYASVEEIKAGEIGRLHGVRYVESTEAKIIGPADIFADVPRTTVHTGGSTATTIKPDMTVTPAQAAELKARIDGGETVKVYVNGTETTITNVTAGAPGTAAFTVTPGVTCSAGDVICGYGAGKDGSAIYCTMLLAKGAYSTTSIKGLGLQHIFKQLGSAGTSDPLNQRATIGWKMTKAAVRKVEEYMVRIEHSTESMGHVAVSN